MADPNKTIQCLAEFDGTGAPTGVIWFDGERHSFTVSTADGSFRVPTISGKTTDKFTVAFVAEVSAGDVLKSGSRSPTIHRLNGQGNHTTWTCTHQ